MRRANGMGTVYKVKGRNLKKPFKALVITGYSENGNPIRKCVGYFKKQTEADMALLEYSKNKDTFDLKKLTVKEVYDRWWGEHQHKIKKNTIKGYNSAYSNYIIKLADRIFTEIKTLELQEFFNKIGTQQTQVSVKKAFMGMYKYAMKYEIVDKNYAALIELKKKVKVKEIHLFTKKEIDFLFESDNRIAKALCIMLYTGIRIDEFLSLTKNDVIDNFIYVREAKTAAGIRPIPIHGKILKIIEFFYNENKDYLFTLKEKNKKVFYETFRYNFDKLMDKLGIIHTPHDTRHTFASMMNKVGVNDVALMTMFGHEDINLTKTVYTHKELEDLEEAIKLLQ